LVIKKREREKKKNVSETQYLRVIYLSGGCSHITMLEPKTAVEGRVTDKIFLPTTWINTRRT